MAGNERKLTVVLAGDASKLNRALSDADGSLSGFGSKLGGIAKTAGFALAGIAGGGAVLAKGFVDAAVESQKVTAQTEAVIKSMGGVAGVTSKQVADLSTALSLKTGVDDELIQSGQNVLLTFGNVQNAVGNGPKVFDRATTAALDMSVALGTDMSSASMQIGKALNDPIDGIAKLGRAGIQFTDEQKETIRTLQEGGDMAGAQAVMLAELERQFGGSAEAQATAGDKLKVAWGNIQEQLGEKLLPVFERVATFLADNLPGAMKWAEDAFARIQPVIATMVASVQENFPKIQAAVSSVVEFVRLHWPQISAVISAAVEVVRGVIVGFVDVVTTLWDNFGNNILAFVQRVWPAIQQVISGAMEVIKGIVATVTALIHGDWSAVWEGIKQTFAGVWNAIQGILRVALEQIRLVLGVGLEILGSVFRAAWDGIVSFFAGIPGRFAGIASRAWSAISAGLSLAITVARTVFENGLDGIVTFFSGMPARVAGIAGRIWESIKSGLAAAVVWVRSQLDRLLGPLDEIAAKIGRLTGLGGRLGEVQGQIAGRAVGGPVTGGTPYIVGERGPELFVPSMSGSIIPNHRLGMSSGGSGGGTTVNVYVQGSVLAERDLIGSIRTALAKGI